jgi:hypothetical protein
MKDASAPTMATQRFPPRFGGVSKILGVLVGSIFVAIASILYFHSYQTLRELPDYSSSVTWLAPSVITESEDAVSSTVLSSNLTELCFPNNSASWLNSGSRRLGNYNDSLMNDEYVTSMILNNMIPLLSDPTHSKVLLQQSLCHSDSIFLSVNDIGDDLINPSNQTIHFWALRFIYFAVHVHQHQHARLEAKARHRHRDKCQPEMNLRKIGMYDYECPDAKFLVVSIGRLGLGAVMRLGVVNGLMAGIATNRTVLIINNAPFGPKFLTQEWPLASCPRKDMQCFYLPTTPCTLTEEELRDAKQLERGETRQVFRMGEIPKHLMDERVLLMDIVLRPQRTPPTFRPVLQEIVMTHLIDPLVREHPDDPRIPMFRKAADSVLVMEPEDGSYYYFGSISKASHALVFYAMRPNLHYAQKLDHIMKQTIPKNFDPDLALGIPIRASDKCIGESECISFEKYMIMMGRVWKKYQPDILESMTRKGRQAVLPESFNASLIVTSEAPAIREAQDNFEKQRDRGLLPFNFHFVNNEYDNPEGTGNPLRMGKRVTNKTVTMDDIMLSAISSLKIQLHARYTIGNCCSNFHLLMFDFLRDGCGASRDQLSECMQDNEDPEFRLCCQWSKTEECVAKKLAKKNQARR